MKLAVAVVSLLAMACSKNADSTPAPAPNTEAGAATTATAPPDPDAPAVVLRTRDGGEVRVRVEVVRDARARRRGLMYRQHLPVDAGMLFIFDVREVQSFWMKNTLIPLDMIFIDSDFSIAGIVENAEPLTLDSRRVGAPSIYVLEINGGLARKWDLDPTARVSFENVDLYHRPARAHLPGERSAP